jgi:MarR family transcriptional regulator, organic hydroperoxide resistance regulator
MTATTTLTTASTKLTRDNLGFLLAKASQRWNEQLWAGFSEHGFGEVRPSYGSVLVPLFEEDNLRIGEIGRRSRLSKQTMTTMVRLAERDGLVIREQDPDDARAVRVRLSDRAREFAPVAESVLGQLDRRVGRALGEPGQRQLRTALAEMAEL